MLLYFLNPKFGITVLWYRIFSFFDFLCAIKVDYSIVDKDLENCSYKIEYKNGDKWDKLIDRSKEVTADTDVTIKFD